MLDNPSLRIVDNRPVDAYVEGHIPGAIHLDLYSISLNDMSEAPFESFMWMLGYLLGSHGIGTDHKVVFYEEDSGMCAAPGFWICEYLGHRDVHVLDGGMSAWKNAGYEVTTDCEEVDTAKFEPEPVPDPHVGYEEIRDSLGRDDFTVLDVRSNDEYYGRVARAARGGTIPGAVHIEYVHNIAENGEFKPAEELRSLYEREGVTPEQTIACH